MLLLRGGPLGLDLLLPHRSGPTSSPAYQPLGHVTAQHSASSRTMIRFLRFSAATPPQTSPSRSLAPCRWSRSEEMRATAACCRPTRRWSVAPTPHANLPPHGFILLCPAEEAARQEDALHVLRTYLPLPPDVGRTEPLTCLLCSSSR